MHAGAIYDRSLVSWLRARGYADVYVYGGSDGPALSVCAGIALDFAVGQMSRFSIGGIWWNSDQHARDPVTNEDLRSNDFYPTIDFIWAG